MRDNYKIVRNISICVLVFLCVTLVCLITNLFAFYKSFLLGVFGLLIYPIIFLSIGYNILILTNRILRFNLKSLSLCLFTLLCFICILHTAFSSNYDMSSIGAYLGQCYVETSVGGVIIGLIVYPFKALLFDVGAYVAFSIGLIISIAMIIDNYYEKASEDTKKPNAQIEKITFTKEFSNTKKEIMDEVKAERQEQVKTIEEQEREKAKEVLGLNKIKQDETTDASTYLYGKNATRDALNTLYSDQNKEIKSQNPNYLNYSLDKYIDESKKPSKIVHSDNKFVPKHNNSKENKDYLDATRPRVYNNGRIISGDSYLKDKNEVDFIDQTTKAKYNQVFEEIKKDDTFDSGVSHSNNVQNTLPKITDFTMPKFSVSDEYENNDKIDKIEGPKRNIAYEVVEEQSFNKPQNDEDEVIFEVPKEFKRVDAGNSVRDKPPYSVNNDFSSEKEQEEHFCIPETEPKIEKKSFSDEVVFKPNVDIKTEALNEELSKPYKPIRYNAPSIEFLTTESSDTSELLEVSVLKKDMLENALESFKIPAKVTDVVVGPAVTRYELIMPPGISVKKILGYADDIAMALKSRGNVRIEAPIPGKNAVGIEVPNDTVATVGLREVLGSREFAIQKSKLSFVLGKDISGEYRFCDLQDAPHLLVAGSTGSGKSVCLNTLIISLLYRCSPEDLKLVLIDPKRVEFATYSGLPHLMMPSIVNDPEKALNTFNWAVNEMEKRYVLFEKNFVRDIGEYNQLPDIINKKSPKMPYIVMIVDELADLMSNNKKEFEEKIAKLTAKSRSAGIHLVLATQRPSVDVITGVIKNNLPSRIAFAVTSGADSKTILDQGGADKLLGRGDMLFWPRSAPEPSRIQGTFITNREIINIVRYIKENNESSYEDNIEKKMTVKNYGNVNAINSLVRGEDDELFPNALKIVIESGRPSKTYLQRCLRLGFSRAANLIDAMEQLHYITPAENGKKGEVFITMEEFIEKYGDV